MANGDKKIKHLIENLASGHPEAQKDLLELAAESSNYDPVVNALISFLEKWNEETFSRESAGIVIFLLGELKAEAAVPILLQFLVFNPKPPITPIFRISASTPPAVSALIKIGENVIPPVLEHLRHSDPKNEVIPVLVEKIISGIIEVEEGRKLIEYELGTSGDKREKGRLEDCLQYFSRK